MKKIFLDANIVVDYMDASSRDHEHAKACLKIIRRHFGKPCVSPVTFIIADFLLGKFIKNKEWHKQQMKVTFSEFEITPLLPSFVQKLFQTYFTDLEDGLQYQCALHAKAKIIITKNLDDFFDSKIPVVHPHDFVNGYNKRRPK